MVVFKIDDINYFAPISSNRKIQRTNLPIYDRNNNIIATIRFCFMFPAPMSVLKEKNFRTMNLIDPKYTDLVASEYKYCLSIEPQILQKAKAVYKIGCNKNHEFNYACCDFKELEAAYYRYLEAKEAEEQAAAAKN